MKQMNEYLLTRMANAIEKKNELELKLEIAKKEVEALRTIYKTFIENQEG